MEVFVDEYPMTLHVLLVTAKNDGFVWVTDTLAATDGGYAAVEKITYLNEYKIACSIWGDQLAMYARDEFLDLLKRGHVPLSSTSEMCVFLRELGVAVIQRHEKEFPIQQSRGVLVAMLGKQHPELYSLTLRWPPIAASILTQGMYGDETNQALFFTNYYYERSEKRITDLLPIGVHTVRMAEVMNTKGIRGLDAWVYEKGAIRQLTSEQIEPYMKLSQSLDATIAQAFANAPELG